MSPLRQLCRDNGQVHWLHHAIRIVAWACILAGLALLAFLHGCDVYTPATISEQDANAAILRAWSDQAAAGNTPPPLAAYELEAAYRAAQDQADAGHWRQPTFTGTMGPVPTTLPWRNR